MFHVEHVKMGGLGISGHMSYCHHLKNNRQPNHASQLHLVGLLKNTLMRKDLQLRQLHLAGLDPSVYNC